MVEINKIQFKCFNIFINLFQSEKKLLHILTTIFITKMLNKISLLLSI
jgi:hypothetical protein